MKSKIISMMVLVLMMSVGGTAFGDSTPPSLIDQVYYNSSGDGITYNFLDIRLQEGFAGCEAGKLWNITDFHSDPASGRKLNRILAIVLFAKATGQKVVIDGSPAPGSAVRCNIDRIVISDSPMLP